MLGGPRAKRLLVVLPAYNEQDSVGVVVAQVRAAQPDAAVLVVDDGSTDRTVRTAREAGARVLSLPFNLGVGGAMRAAYRLALREGFDELVQVDADGQHDPADIAALRERLAGADIVIGARFAGVGSYRVRGPRRCAMRLMASVVGRVAGTRLTDATSGFKVCNRRAILLFAATYPEEYLGDTVEALVTAARAGLRVEQVPVAMRARMAGEPSTNPIRSAFYLVRALLALGLALVRRPVRLAEIAPAPSAGSGTC